MVSPQCCTWSGSSLSQRGQQRWTRKLLEVLLLPDGGNCSLLSAQPGNNTQLLSPLGQNVAPTWSRNGQGPARNKRRAGSARSPGRRPPCDSRRPAQSALRGIQRTETALKQPHCETLGHGGSSQNPGAARGAGVERAGARSSRLHGWGRADGDVDSSLDSTETGFSSVPQ